QSSGLPAAAQKSAASCRPLRNGSGSPCRSSRSKAPMTSIRPSRERRRTVREASSLLLAPSPTRTEQSWCNSPSSIGCPGSTGSGRGVPTGDALYVSVGNRIETFRYIGIRRPDILHPTRGREPYEEIVRAVNSQLVESKWVTLILDAQPRDRYGQLLAYVYVGKQFINAELVHRGYAEAATYPPNVRYQEYFLGLEQGARAAGRGLWADRAAQAYYRSRPLDEETEVGGTKSFRF